MKYNRLHLFEFEDFPWYPNIIREGQTDYLRFMMNLFNVFRAVIPLLQEGVEKSGKSNIIDLCSGGGGSMMLVRKHFKVHSSLQFKALLTDLFPNKKSFDYIKKESEGEIDYYPNSVDARNLPESFDGFLTMFNGFHHFRPEEAKGILKNVMDRKLPLGIFEPIDKSIWQMIANTFALTILLFLATPFIRPFKWSRIIFTYFIPLIPICTLWDGWVSVIRLYNPQSMEKLLSEVDTTGYEWKAGKASHPFGKVIYLLGWPKN
ncbi:MAG: class I SAM-dependent methyltransferase [Flammeovirgaceae bacterium]|nr:class I SAM-dependent methyltransferase [Flammeovirgaceae bacterium]